MTTTASSARPRLRPIALPTEHGGWSIVLEPIILGLWIAPSWAGLLLGIAAFAAFLVRHPLELALRDHQRDKRYPRTIWAERFVIGYGGLALITAVLAFITTAHAFWQPIIIATPLALIQLSYDFKRRSRELVPEITGALALASVAPVLALADGWALDAAMAVWIILAARLIGTILYVRARLRLERGEDSAIAPAHLAHIVGLAAVSGLTVADLAPWLVIPALIILLARSFYGLSSFRGPAPRAAIIGVQEVIFGIITVVLVALGYTI